MMAPDPSEFVTNDDHSSALLFRSRLFPAFGDYQIKPHAPSQPLPREVGVKSRPAVDHKA
jgi:hypothetical protein